MANLEKEIAALHNLSRTDLVTRWSSFYRTPPPKGISRALLIRAIAYRMQAKRWGGLKPSTLNGLRKAAAREPSKAKAALPETRLALKPGVRLLREWNGQTHQVEVVETGFLWNDARYRSLSAVARAITGARWSGPRFFGLTGPRSS